MIVSIRHTVLKSLFEKGTASGVSRGLKDVLLLWLSVIHAAKDPGDLAISKVSMLEKDDRGYRLYVNGVGTFSFLFVDGEVRLLNYKQEPK